MPDFYLPIPTLRSSVKNGVYLDEPYVGIIDFCNPLDSSIFDHQTKNKMKKLSTSVSPFLMLIIPVLFAILLSLSFKANTSGAENELTTTVSSRTSTQKLVKTGETTIIRLLLTK